MKKAGFFSRLNKEGKLELVEISEEIKESYLNKANNCLRASKILLKNEIYENSVSEAYYCMYNSLLALFFKTGIKCENHSASIILLKKLFEKNELFEIISFAKTERIDKQYHVESEQNLKPNKELGEDMIKKAEDFFIKIRLIIHEMNNEKINEVREGFKRLIQEDI